MSVGGPTTRVKSRIILIARFQMYSLVLMAVVAGTCVDVNSTNFVGKRRATRRFSHKLFGRIGPVVLTRRSRHISEERKASTKAPESRAQVSKRRCAAERSWIWAQVSTGFQLMLSATQPTKRVLKGGELVMCAVVCTAVRYSLEGVAGWSREICR